MICVYIFPVEQRLSTRRYKKTKMEEAKKFNKARNRESYIIVDPISAMPMLLRWSMVDWAFSHCCPE